MENVKEFSKKIRAINETYGDLFSEILNIARAVEINGEVTPLEEGRIMFFADLLQSVSEKLKEAVNEA